MVSRMILSVILGVAALGFCGALDIPSFPAGFESRCLLPGLAFLQGCEVELKKSLEFFGLEKVRKLSPEEEQDLLAKLDDFIASGTGKPRIGCCRAFCGFNNAVCSCEPVARDYTASFFGGAETLERFLDYYAEECQTKDLFNECPATPVEVATSAEPLNNCAVFAEDLSIAAAPAPESEDLNDEELDSMFD